MTFAARGALGGFAAALVVVTRAALPATVPQGDGLPVGFCVAREMDYIPEVDDWPSCKPDAFADEAARAIADWTQKQPWVQKQLRPALVRALSQWARKEMAGYASAPSLAKVTFKPIRHHERSRKLVLEGTADTLPSHSKLVTRWLKVFLLCDKSGGRVLRVTITIRGQLLE